MPKSLLAGPIPVCALLLSLAPPAPCPAQQLDGGAGERIVNGVETQSRPTTGALLGSATGKFAPGDCTTCHSGNWDALHPTTAFDHSGLVTVGTTSCTGCHDDTLISAAAETHNACINSQAL